MALDYDKTWIGLLGGGVSGSILAGGSVFQIDVWNMGGERLPARALVKGKRVGIMAETGTALAMLLVTGCKTAKEMDGITSSGIDWELAVGVKGSALVKSGAKLFKIAAAKAAATGANWAMHESAKRLAQWAMDDLGVVQPGKQFNLLPSPLALGVGAGVFYEWQTLSLLGGKIGWQYISPKWFIQKSTSGVRLQMYNIPEQDGQQVRVGFAIDEWGIDPFIRWKKKGGDVRIDSQNTFHIVGYCYGGYLFERPDGMGYSGINLGNIQPIGKMQTGLMSTSNNSEVQKGGTMEVYPVVFRFGNYPYWTADDTVEMKLGTDGSFVSAKNGEAIKG